MVATKTQEVFNGLPGPIRTVLLNLRALILDTAAENPAIGPIEETFKWGEPAYLPSTTKSGTTIRINRYKKSAGCSQNLDNRATLKLFHSSSGKLASFHATIPPSTSVMFEKPRELI